MAKWQELIKKENLTDEELSQIPASLVTAYISNLEYLVNTYCLASVGFGIFLNIC